MAAYPANREDVGSRHYWLPERPRRLPEVAPPSLQRLGPLHVGAGAPGTEAPKAQLRSVVEAVLRRRYAGGEEVPDPRTTEGMRAALLQEPSLAWAEPYAAECVKLLKQRRSASTGCLTPIGKESRAPRPGRLPPVDTGGFGFMKTASQSSLSGAAAAKMAGVEAELTAPLAWRLRELATSRPEVVAWLVVEACRDCGKDHPVVGHDEKVFQSRFDSFKAAVERNFPEEVQVELLAPRRVDDDEAQPPPGAASPIRPGAFEVYLCCPEPLAAFGAVSLPAWACDRDSPEAPPAAFSAICLASKLQAKGWPNVESVLRRLITTLPRIPLKVHVRTKDGMPVPGVDVSAVTSHVLKRKDWTPDPEQPDGVAGGVRASGQTNAEGLCRFSVPLCVRMRLEARHDMLLGRQEREILLTQIAAEEVFVAKTTVQLWQLEEGQELVVFCSSPRSTPQPSLPGPCEPFRGFLEGHERRELRPDAAGCVRGAPSLLQQVQAVGCKGWRPSRVTLSGVDIHGSGRAHEVARLAYPIVKVGLVLACCGAKVPGAQVAVDGRAVGDSGASGEPVSCGLRHGEHSIEARHLFCPDGMTIPFEVRGSATCTVQAKLSTKRLRFVCVASRRGMTPSAASADLWLVGGRLEDCRFGKQTAPPEDHIWLWDGDLRGASGEGDEEATLSVQGGVLRSFHKAGLPPREGAACLLTKAMEVLVSQGDWHVAISAALDTGGCAMEHLARSARDTCSELWLGSLAKTAGGKKRGKAARDAPRRLWVRSACCGSGCCAASAEFDGEEAVPLDGDGCCELPARSAGERLRIRINHVLPCLLPGGASEFIASYGPSEFLRVDLEVSCSLWVYWVPEEDDGESELSDCMVLKRPFQKLPSVGTWLAPLFWPAAAAEPARQAFVALDPEQIPDHARPVAGVLRCLGAECTEVELDGRTMGPFVLCAAPRPEDGGPDPPQCILAGLSLEMRPPTNYVWAPKDPSPLAERCAEVGGCELLRLAKCPVALGALQPMPPPPPLWLALRSACCRRGFCGAEVSLNGEVLPPCEADAAGVFALPRRRITDARSGELSLEITGVPAESMPTGSPRFVSMYGVGQPEELEVNLSCALWVYWMPPDPEAEEDTPAGQVFIVAGSQRVPEGAQPVRGRVDCAGALEPSVTLDGSLLGPVRFAPGPAGVAGAPCMLKGLRFAMEPPEDFEFLPGSWWAPQAEGDAAAGGACVLQSLAAAPLAIGTYRALPLPPLVVQLRTGCCGSAFEGAEVEIDGAERVPLGDGGCVTLPRRRVGGSFCTRFYNVPPCLLPGGSPEITVDYKPKLPVSVQIDVQCLVWVYWLFEEEEAEEEEEGEGDEEPALSDFMVCIATNREHVPEEARPVTGALLCPSAFNPRMTLDGSTIGPFRVRPQTVGFAQDEDAPLCLLSSLKFELDAPLGFEYRPKEVTPMLERCRELGGCELQRVSQCAAAVGTFRDLPHPNPQLIRLCTKCCGRGWPGATIMFEDAKAKVVGDQAGDAAGSRFRVPVRPREQRDDTREAIVRISGVPANLLPDGSAERVMKCGPFVDEECHKVDVACMLWVYWVPPGEDEDDEGVEFHEEDPEPATGMVFVATDPSQVPEEAQPVEGYLNCPGAETESIRLTGKSIGPFSIACKKPETWDDDNDTDSADVPPQEACLLSKLSFDVDAPAGFEYDPKDPTPLAERLQELGGCELERLAMCPQVVGVFRSVPRPPMEVALRTSCCRRCFAGVDAAVDGEVVRSFGDSGRMEFRRRRNGGAVFFALQGLPEHFLPGGASRQGVAYEAFAPKHAEIEVSCLFWVYWLPPDDEEVDEEDDDPEPQDGMIFIAVDPAQVPAEAKPVKGFVACPGASTERLDLDGGSVGPFRLAAAAGSDTEAEVQCLLGALSFSFEPPEDYVFQARDPSPMRERVEELGGCELERLLACPALVAKFCPTPRPPLRLCLRTLCCRRGLPGACLALGDAEPEPFDEDGCVEVRRKRDGGVQFCRLDSVPVCLLGPGGAERSVAYGPTEPESEELEVACPLWVYWVPPPGADEGPLATDGDEEQGAAAVVYIAVDGAHIPEGAEPVQGVVECPGAVSDFLASDGTSMGPFYLRVPPGGRAATNCLLARLFFMLNPPDEYEFEPREPSPLEELSEELGGSCLLTRLAEGPIAVGTYRLVQQPPLELSVRTPCCGRCFGGATAAFCDREPIPFGDDGCLRLKRRPDGAPLRFRLGGIPANLLPDGTDEQVVCYTPEDSSATVEVACNLWVYWVPPDEEDEEEDGDEDALPPEGTVWVAVDRDQIPDEAQPLPGVVEGPAGEVVLDGASMGPFPFRSSPGDMCSLAALVFKMGPLDGYEYRARDPSPLQERCADLGGCELERVAGCPVTVGFLKKAA